MDIYRTRGTAEATSLDPFALRWDIPGHGFVSWGTAEATSQGTRLTYGGTAEATSPCVGFSSSAECYTQLILLYDILQLRFHYFLQYRVCSFSEKYLKKDFSKRERIFRKMNRFQKK